VEHILDRGFSEDELEEIKRALIVDLSPINYRVE